MSTYWAASAWLPTGIATSVRIEVTQGLIASVTRETPIEDGDQLLPGVVLPGFVNAHSHAFHRALRGRTHDRGGTFWTWRSRMYAIAARLSPDAYLNLARATYAEMALAGVTSVGEFHYLHHAPGGTRYNDPNEMGHALREAASDAGIRLTLLDTCYLAGGLTASGHTPLDDVQARFGDGSAGNWAARAGELKPGEGFRVGAAIHSVRAVPLAQIPVVAAFDGPLHVHLSEQPAENEACSAFYGRTPASLLGEGGALGGRTTAVHATHLTPGDIALLGSTRTAACICPTTERDLGDGIGPARALFDAGAPLALGSDQHAVIDLLEEARALEADERLGSLERGRFTPSQILGALTNHAAIGWPEVGRIEVGAAADLVAVRLDSVRTAGSDPGQVVMSASGADVDTVLVGGRAVVSGGRHVLGDVGRLLSEAIDPLWSEV